MVVRMSALCIGHSIPPGRLLVFIFVSGWIDNKAAVYEGISSTEKFSGPVAIELVTFLHGE
jgi:hypothetical protein